MEKLKDYEKEIKSFHGIEYMLVLTGFESENGAIINPENTNPKIWWNLEYTEKTKLIATSAANNILWFSTDHMQTSRMKDKYHECELQAMKDIVWLMEEYPTFRRKWLWNEIKCFYRAMTGTFKLRLIYKFKKTK